MNPRRYLIASVTFVLLIGTVPLLAAPIDATLFTTYNLVGGNTHLKWLVCGSTQMTSGCYGIGTLGPFGRVGALIEGNPTEDVATNTVTRYIYVLDVASGSAKDGVSLWIYKKVDTVTTSTDGVTITLFQTVDLPLTGGVGTVPSMAANKKFIYVGTNQDPLPVQLRKRDLSLLQFGGGISTSNVTAITADQYGYVSVIWGNGNGLEVLDPNGRAQSEGGGADFMLNTMQAIRPSTLRVQ